ncbi:hypothetical protein AAE478_008778 [Parahypoxylon ruwenzoriense]
MIAYKPTLIPGDSKYSRVHFIGTNTRDADGANDSECLCGSELLSEASKLPADECKTPCTGDARLSCGGADTVAVYSLLADKREESSESDPNRDDDDADGNGNDAEDRNQPILGSSPPSPTLAGASALVKATGASNRAEVDSNAPAESSSPPDSPGAPTTSFTIAAVTGSLSLAIILAAFLFLSFRAYKRKKQEQGAHVQTVVNKQQQQQRQQQQLEQQQRQWRQRAAPDPINTTGHYGERSFDAGGASGDRIVGLRRKQGDHVHVPRGDEDNDRMIVPTTPALESGGRGYPPGLHSRHAPLSTPTSFDQDSLYGALMGEVRTGPAVGAAISSDTPPTPSAASSSVQWRDISNIPSPSPMTPTAPAPLFGARSIPSPRSQAAVPSPAHAAQPSSNLGDRAWHRRKLSTPFQPPPSGPPSIPLPPLPPMRPHRSFDTIRFGPSPSPSPSPSSISPAPAARNGDNRGDSRSTTSTPRKARRQEPPPPLELEPKNMYALGGLANRSSPSLASPLPMPTPALKESPTLPLRVTDGDAGSGHVRREEARGGDGNRSGDSGRQTGRDNWPVSTSTISTSILFPLDEEEGRLP